MTLGTSSTRYLMLGVVTVGALGWAFAAPLAVQPESKLWVTGTSTVRSWECKAPRIQGVIGGEVAADGSAAQVAGAVKSAEVTVPSALACGNGTMDGHLKKALKADQFPAIKFKVAAPKTGAAAGEAVSVQLPGQLTIAGQERPVTVNATVTKVAGGVRVKGSEQIVMSQWGVRPPTLMMGTMKVGDPVTVHFDLVLKP